MRIGAILWIVGGALASCAKVSSSDFDSESVVVATCQASIDQRKTFMATAASIPLHLQLDSTFTASERASLETAIAQWNLAGQNLIGHPFFDFSYVALSSTYHVADPRDCLVRGMGTEDTLAILRESSSQRWNSLSFGDTIPAATLRCFSGQHVNHQLVMVYVNVIDAAQFASVVLHELGHVIGLDHSCTDGAGSEKFVSCAGLAETHPYHVAVMYPSLRSRPSTNDLPEIKEQLKANDLTRTSCLYNSSDH